MIHLFIFINMDTFLFYVTKHIYICLSAFYKIYFYIIYTLYKIIYVYNIFKYIILFNPHNNIMIKVGQTNFSSYQWLNILTMDETELILRFPNSSLEVFLLTLVYHLFSFILLFIFLTSWYVKTQHVLKIVLEM